VCGSRNVPISRCPKCRGATTILGRFTEKGQLNSPLSGPLKRVGLLFPEGSGVEELYLVSVTLKGCPYVGDQRVWVMSRKVKFSP
jgi:hypothetical protein